MSVCPSTLTGTRPKGDGMELSPFLIDGVVEFPKGCLVRGANSFSPVGDAYPSGASGRQERGQLMVVGQRLRCKGSELSFVNVNGRGDECGPIGKVLLNALT